ncbi:hypothetical protein VPNG_07210 [Cytospora leucostoma]|uniref:2-methoxy-6-polyprenyl-1,4-benzoquinol methylase, mitochondrial n=1 Tax=Cytospora leucostoma TaxID=1230097 RepID=A0A423WJL8_9PEZI|nr:hypothetical protein VPNG_07210 [Cytospora leucostoma]
MAASRPVMRSAVRTCLQSGVAAASAPRCAAAASIISRSTPRTFSTSNTKSDAAPNNAKQTEADRATHFGFETVTEAEKRRRVAEVFSNVAETYDKMNDLMSFGWHRVWKDHYVSTLNPGFSADPNNPQPQHILDIAGGTGDIAFRHLHQAHVVNRNPNVRVTISDINPNMLAVGKQRSASLPAGQQASLSFLEANAEDLRGKVGDASVDLYTVAFGIRNFSDIPAALREAHRVLKPGGVLAVLEFSKADRFPLFNSVYKRWSFGAIPLIGQLVAGDRDSYQYLVESIERFPSQRDFRDMIVEAGFVVGGQGYEDLTGGVAAIHTGLKPKV